MEAADSVHVCGADKLNDNWNVYKKDSTRPKLTLYLTNVENVVAYIFWWLAKRSRRKTFA